MCLFISHKVTNHVLGGEFDLGLQLIAHITEKIWHFLVQEIGTIHTRLLKHLLNLHYEGNLNK